MSTPQKHAPAAYWRSGSNPGSWGNGAGLVYSRGVRSGESSFVRRRQPQARHHRRARRRQLLCRPAVCRAMKSLRSFKPRLEILPTPQRRLWPELNQTPENFTLYGGTALALRLAHRQSADFDFFSNKPISGQRLLSDIPYLHHAKIRQLEPNTLVTTVRRVGTVQLSFFGDLSIGQVEPAELAEGPRIKVASLRDIAGTKLSVVMQRAEAKDYLDIHALLTQGKLSLPEMLACAQAIFGHKFNPATSLKALSHFGDPKLKKLPEGIRRDLIAAIRSTDLSQLPTVKPVRARERRP